MRRQWHPLLAQFLREDHGERLNIEDSVKLGKMPLEIDMLINPNVPKSRLESYSKKRVLTKRDLIPIS